MALSKQDARMAFRCEQYDTFAETTRHYILMYFYGDRSIEMIEEKTGKVFLKRSSFEVPRSGFYLGAVISVCGRPTTITDYADHVTKQLCEEFNEKTTIVIEEAAFTSLGRCLSILTEECGFTAVNVQMLWVKPEAAMEHNLPFAADMQSGTRLLVVECARSDAIAKGNEYTRRVPNTYAAASTEQAALWAQLIEQASRKPLCVFDEENSSVVVIKPEMIALNRAGSAIQQLIDLGLEPTAFAQRAFSAAEANRFLRAYRGVLPDMEGTIASFVGNVWVLQFVSLDDSVDVVSTVREACGPFDPVIAKKLFPKTIRARFGKDCAHNGIHCCDLPGEGPVYADFFFTH